MGAYAQSTVEIYGIIDQSYSNTTIKASADDGSTKATINNTGTQSGLATQRIGFRGTEDLGGGLKGLFQIENALSAGSAGTNGFGSRPTFVGLSGGFGTLTLGRQDTPLLKAVVPQLAGGANNMVGQLMWSPFGAPGELGALADIGAATIADAGFGRLARETTIDRAINYLTPSLSGFTAELQVGQSDVKIGASDGTALRAKTDDTGLNLRYANGPLTLAAASHVQKVSTATATTGKNTNNYVGATYNLGFANLSIQHGESKRTNDADGEIYKNKGTQLGAQVPVSATTALFGSYGKGKRAFDNGTDKAKQTSFQLGATYALSKRTKLYAVYGMQELKGDSEALAGVKWKETQYGVGVNHSF